MSNDTTTPDGGAPNGGAPDTGDNQPSMQQIQNDAANAKAAAGALSGLSSGLVGGGTTMAGMPWAGIGYTAFMADQYSKFAAGVDAKVAQIAQERLAEANIPPEYQQLADAMKQEFQAQQQVDQDIAAGKGVPATDSAATAAAYDKFATDLNNQIQAETKTAQIAGQNGSGDSPTDSPSSSTSVPTDGGDGGGGGGGE